MTKIYKPKTFFIDIDGTILFQKDFDDMSNAITNDIDTTTSNIEVLTESFKVAVDRINEWFNRGDHIIFTTARPENLRTFTVTQLAIMGVAYNQLVMGIGRSTRVLINNLSDKNPTEHRARAYEIFKNDTEAFNLIDE